MKKSEDVTSGADSDIKILLAEDNEINSFLFIEMLGKLGFGCDLAENGEEAVSACGKNAYDIIFMDCKMPVMDGIDATKRIRTLEGYGKKIKIFALTAQTLNQEKDICIQAGMDGFISKPVSMSSLKEIIDKYGANKKTEGNTKKSTGAINKNIPAFMKENSLDRESSEKLMDLFLKQSEKSIKEIRKFIDEENTKEIKFLLHRLKGSAGNMGMTSIYKEAKNAETFINEGDLKKVNASVEKISRALKKIL